MAFERPSLSDLATRIQADIEARLGAAGKVLRRSVVAVLARVFAGVAHSQYGYLDWISKQAFPDTAETEYLDRWASIWLDVPRKSASYAQGSVTFTGAVGAVIPQGTILKRSDEIEFVTDTELILSGATGSVAVTASTAGEISNTAEAAELQLVSPLATVQTTAVVATGGLVGGADQEKDEDLRARLLERIQTPPHGGNQNDYEQWALENSGVTRAWVYPDHLGPGTVGVCFVMDDKAGSIIPAAGDVANVQTYIDERRPVTADVTVFAPTASALDFTIQLTPNTASVQAAVQAELEDLLRRESEPAGTLKLSHINEAISIAAGETDHVLSSPSADVTASTGEIKIMGSITWL